MSETHPQPLSGVGGRLLLHVSRGSCGRGGSKNSDDSVREGVGARFVVGEILQIVIWRLVSRRHAGACQTHLPHLWADPQDDTGDDAGVGILVDGD